MKKKQVYKPPKKPKPPTYSWLLGPAGVVCSKSSAGGQTIARLWETSEPTDAHDEQLARATREINQILISIERSNRDPERKLSFIEFENRHLLVWASYGAVSRDDDEREVAKALKLKR